MSRESGRLSTPPSTGQILQAMTMPGLTHPLNIYLLCTNGLAPLMNVTAATYHFEAARAAKIACVKLTYKRENVKNFADAGVEKAKRIRYISEAMPTRLLGQTEPQCSTDHCWG